MGGIQMCSNMEEIHMGNTEGNSNGQNRGNVHKKNRDGKCYF